MLERFCLQLLAGFSQILINKMTDTERLNKLQEIVGRYTGKVICRISTSGRGLRLHETSRHGAVESIREAIDNFLMEQEVGWNEIEQHK